MLVQISEQDKVRGRHHMGYLNVAATSSYSLGIPAAVQTQFMIEGAWDKILPTAVPYFRMLLDRLDSVECEVFGGLDMASITEIGEVKVNGERLKELAKYYKIAQEALGNLLGVPPNPFDMRTWLAPRAINVGVTG